MITATPLTAERFAEYGFVITLPGPDTKTARYSVAFPDLPSGGQTELSITWRDAARFPAQIDRLERHTASPQAFVPIRCSKYLVVVCGQSATGLPAPESLHAFIASSEQAVVYSAGTWHHPLSLIESGGTFAVAQSKTGTDLDTEWYYLSKKVEVDLQSHGISDV